MNITILPVELLLQIFANLDVGDLLTCIKVSVKFDLTNCRS